MIWLLLIMNIAHAAEWKAKLTKGGYSDTVNVLSEGYPEKYRVKHTHAGEETDLSASFPQVKALTDAIDAISLAHTTDTAACESELTLESPFGDARVCSPEASTDRKVRTLLGDLRRVVARRKH